jgi:hypothetical protein
LDDSGFSGNFYRRKEDRLGKKVSGMCNEKIWNLEKIDIWIEGPYKISLLRKISQQIKNTQIGRTLER